MSATCRELLLLLAVTDLHESGDDEVGEYLEHLLGALEDDLEDGAMSDELRPSCLELRESILDQMEKDAPEREEVAQWLFDYAEVLPEDMTGFSDEVERFDRLLEALFEEDEIEEVERVRRFLQCIELLEEDEWKQRSEAARGLGTLEEEMFTLRDDYLTVPMELKDCDAHSVVTRVHMLEAFATWQKAFRNAHQGQLDEAADNALEGACLFTAVERWAGERVGVQEASPT